MATKSNVKSKSALASSTSKLFLASFDPGNSMFNIAADGGVKVDVRSEYGPMTEASHFNDLNPLEVVEIGDQRLVFGGAARTLASINELTDYTSLARYRTEWYRTLISYGLYRSFHYIHSADAVEPFLVLSVPAGIYRRPDELKAVRDNILGDHIIKSLDGWEHSFVLRRENLMILPEGSGTFFKCALGQGSDSNASVYQTGAWAVLDWGFGTLDLTVYRNTQYMADAARSNPDVGIRQVVKIIYEMIESGSRPKMTEIDEIMGCSTFAVNGKTYEIGPQKERTTRALARQGSRWASGELSGYNLLGAILTGGGSPIFAPHLDRTVLPARLEHVADPYRANADGGLLFAMKQLEKPE